MIEPPGVGEPPPQPTPTGRSRRIGWLLAGVATLVVLAGVTVFTVQQVRAGDEAADPDGTASYGFVPDLCQAVDFTPVFNMLPHNGERPVDSANQEGTTGTRICAFALAEGSAVGGVNVHVTTFGDDRAATMDFGRIADRWSDHAESSEPLEEPWHEGAIGIGNPSGSDAAALLYGRTGNLTLVIQFLQVGDPDTTDAQAAAAVLAVAADVLSRASRT